MKTFNLICWILLFVSFCVGAGFYSEITLYARQPLDGRNIEKKLDIAFGEQFETTLDHLTASGMVRNPLKFRFYAKFKGYDQKIKAGEYLISTRMSPEELLMNMVSGKVVLYRFTIPEGYSLAQIADVIVRNGWGTRDDFLNLTKDPEFIHSLGMDAQTLEGYLYPETYFFPKGAELKKIISAMINRFNKVYTPQWKTRAEELGLSIHQVVTLASIIEKETGNASERPVIASVFHNRLNKKMRLESDPTVIYGIPNFNGDITKKDLMTVTPYNTYKISGLPPGPIASPGAKSLEAALYPAQTPFLFFVSKNNGSHQFSRTMEEHEQAVRQYQLSR